ncbi:restriction endonuclease subunit S [Prevotella melaninogenica]|uniref:restriction endonuclease subunit S n=1 Tax=Prevotella melaninogenica TaxID=28132 RepID=UPI001BAA6CD9|nr:restriction endonuclease subunit S [Prevotella melaninogenica]QUB65111.1 restriction endonuclease subunit S [Prevotella melaninogenica]
MKEGWEYKKIGDIATVVSGSTPQTSVEEFWGKGHYWVTPAELDDKTVYVSKTERQITDAALAKVKLQRLPKGTVLFSSRAPIGKVAICDVDMYCNQGFKNCICSDLVYNKYLFYFLKDKKEYLNSLGRGATFKEISKGIVEKVIVPLPPKPTQLSIVSELDKLNELIQIKKEQLKDYDALAQSIFYEMFGNPVENEKGWEVKKLKDISRKIGDGLHGTPEYSELDTGWYFINGNNLENGCISIKSTTKKVTDSVRKKYYIEMDDFTLLVSINGTLGKSAFYNGENVILGKSACYIKLNKDVNKLFIYEIIRGEYFKRYAESVCTGTTIRNVSLKAMREFPIIYPPLSLQQSFAHKIEQIERQKAGVQKTITDLETLLAARMQYWFD